MTGKISVTLCGSPYPFCGSPSFCVGKNRRHWLWENFWLGWMGSNNQIIPRYKQRKCFLLFGCYLIHLVDHPIHPRKKKTRLGKNRLFFTHTKERGAEMNDQETAFHQEAHEEHEGMQENCKKRFCIPWLLSSCSSCASWWNIGFLPAWWFRHSIMGLMFWHWISSRENWAALGATSRVAQ